VELFNQLAEYFQSIVEFPTEGVETITSEQYVRNVVDILFRSRKG